MEAQVAIDGQPLGLGLVDQRDAVEVVLQLLAQHRRVITQMFAQEGVITPVLLVLAQETDAMVRVLRVKSYHVNTFLLGAAVVVLGLHLQEVQARVHIGADAQFLTARMPVLVNDVHVVVGRVEIGRVIGRNAYTIDILGAIVIPGELQQQPEPVNRCDKLGVGAVHQLDATHLVEGDRVICPDYLVHKGAKLY